MIVHSLCTETAVVVFLLGRDIWLRFRLRGLRLQYVNGILVGGVYVPLLGGDIDLDLVSFLRRFYDTQVGIDLIVTFCTPGNITAGL